MADNKALTKIKKHIDRQTRELVGNVRVDSKSSKYVEKPVDIPEEKIVPVSWDCSYFYKNRGDYFDLDQESFRGSIYGIKRSTIQTELGNFSFSPKENYINARFSCMLGRSGGGLVRFKIKARQSSIAIYVDGNEVYGSGDLPYTNTSINIAVGEKSLVQIYWYCSTTGNNVFSLEGDISKQIDFWEQSDNTPVHGGIVWDSNNPISTGVSIRGGEIYPYVNLNVNIMALSTRLPLGLDAIGIYNLIFQEIGEAKYISSEYVEVLGTHDPDGYIKVSSSVYKIEKAEPFYDNNGSLEPRTKIYTEESVTEREGVSVYVGILEHKGDAVPTKKGKRIIPMRENDIAVWSFTVTDYDVENGEDYYYLLDTVDNSLNFNRGSMTNTYQTITAGDSTAPAVPTITSAVRSGYDTITIRIAEPTDDDIKEYHVWESFSHGTDYTINHAGYKRLELSSSTGLAVGDPVALSSTGNTTEVRQISSIRDNNVILETETSSVHSGGTLRKLNNAITVPLRAINAGDPEFGLIYDTRIVISNLSIGSSYEFWVSAMDVAGNETFESINSTGEIEFANPTTPTLSNVTHIFSSYTDIGGLDGPKEIFKEFGEV